MATKYDRRTIHDRRLDEAGPPQGWGERRRTVERRMIAVAEVSYEEWAAAQGETRPQDGDFCPVLSYDSPR